MNWSAVQMFKDNPDTTVEATMLVRPRMKCKKIRVMLSSMPLADMAPPKHMAANDQPNRVHHPGHSPGRD